PTTLYENDQVVQSWAMSSGLPGSPTLPGSFRIGWKTPMQDMGCFPGAPYCTENVPWVSYFNGDQAFHGAYWHNNFGNVMSHGCVNLPVNAAKFIYDWAPQGTQVSVHY
ncbi:L,D-transpeptidase, partial [Microbacterium lushaniae]